MRLRLPSIAALLVIAAGAGAQAPSRPSPAASNPDPGLEPPEDVSLEELVTRPANFPRAIRTRGELWLEGRDWEPRLRERLSVAVLLPGREVADPFEVRKKDLVNHRIEVTGTVGTRQREGGGRELVISFWSFTDLGVGNALPPPRDTTLGALVTSPGKRDGQLVRVAGRFRGRNLYRDLPAISQRRRADWVIKDELFAVWVTGRPPKGEGFDLDPEDKRDTDRWLEVVGWVQTFQDVTFLRAESVRLASPPAAAAPKESAPKDVTPKDATPRPRRAAPVVIFSLPVDGDEAVPPDARFVVQFSQDMAEATFRGRVVLRYAGRAHPGDLPLAEPTLSYDGGRRALTVEPASPLSPARRLELVLLPGIADLEGLELEPRTGVSPADAVDVLRFRISR